MLEVPVRIAKLCSVAVVSAAAALPFLASAQSVAPAPVVSVPVVQGVPEKAPGMRLNDALARLARNPQDVDALGAAGQASLDLGDAQAAIGFYRRALSIQPANARIKAGLAGAYLLNEDPFTAIDLFDEAEKAGPIDPARLADRGLAFDLVGDSQTAQTYYRQSLAAAPNDETLRRLGLSQAIARDRKGMDLTLSPLLQKQDKAAWRTRAFGLAIIGQVEEAESIARQTMPADMAGAITAYLRYMPRLTAAQQAAAGNLGRFPRAAEIGSDDPRMAAYSRTKVQVAAAQAPQSAASPAKPRRGEKTMRSDKGAKSATASPVQAVVPPPEPTVGREVQPAAARLAQAVLPASAAPRAASPAPVTSAPVRPAPLQTALVQPAAAPPTPAAPAEKPVARAVSLDLVTTSVPAPQPARTTSIDEAFADLAPPSREIEPQAGAVDVRQLRSAPPPAVVEKELPAIAPPARARLADARLPDARLPDPKAKDAKGKAAASALATAKDAKAKDAPAKVARVKDAKAKDGSAKDAKTKDAKAKDDKAKPSAPSRIWVQIAAGRDKAALAFDWRKWGKADPAVFKGRNPHVTAWGQTNRLLTGPFGSAKEANAYIAQLKKAGYSGVFVWTSPAGQVVDALGGGK